MVVFFCFFYLKWLNRTSLWRILSLGLKGWMQRCQFSLLLESGRCRKAPSDHWIKGTKSRLAWSASRAVAANTGLNPSSYWFCAHKTERIGSVLNCYVSRYPFASIQTVCVSLCPSEKQNKRHYLPLQKKEAWMSLTALRLTLVYAVSDGLLTGVVCFIIKRPNVWHLLAQKGKNTFCVYIFS